MSQRPRLAIVVSHPIQYYVPWYRALARLTDLEVFFCHRQDSTGQANAGFDVEFDWDVPLLDGYSFTWLKNRAHRPSVSRFFGCDTPDLHEYLDRRRFDACIVSGWYLKSYVQAIQACKRAGVPALLRGDSQLGTARTAIWRAAKYVPYSLLLNAVNGHLYVGEANREYLRYYRVPASRLFFVPHFVDNDFFRRGAAAAHEQRADAEIRGAAGFPESAKLFLFVAKLIAKKRPSDFIRAVAAAAATDDHIRGLMVGSGPLRPELERLAMDLGAPVRFVGFRNQTELPAYFAAADALVLASDAGETWGLVVNEAMACGLPAVVSDAAGCARDLIEDGVTGYRFSMGNVHELSDAMIRLSRDLNTRRAAIQAAVRAKIESYSVNAATAGTLEALEAIGACDRRPVADQASEHSEIRSSHVS